MPPGQVKVDFKAQVTQMRGAFKEMKKLQGEHQKRSQQQIKAEQKHQREAMAAVKKQYAEKRKESEKEYKDYQKLQREKARDAAKQQSQRRRREQDKERARRKEKDHAKGMERGRGGRGVGGLALGGAAFAAGGIIGMIVGSAFKGYQNYLMAHQAMGGAIGLGGNPSSAAWGSSKRGNLGYNVVERSGMMPIMGRATGVIDPRAMMTGSRATGMDPGELGGIYGAIRRGGTQFSGQTQKIVGGQYKDFTQTGEGEKEFAKMIELGMVSGLERARLPEYFQSVTQLMEQQEQTQSGKVGHGPFSRFLAVMGKFGEERGLSGFQGSRGGGLMNKIHQGMVAPQNDYSKSLMLQAFGFGKPGGTTSFYEAEKRREKGLGGENNFNDVMAELMRQGGGMQDWSMSLQSMFGTSKQQGEDLVNLYNSGATAEEKQAGVEKILAESKTLEEQALDEFKKSGGQLSRIAARFDKFAGIGSKVAKYIEKIEDWQMRFMEMVIDLLPKIELGIKKIAEIIGELLEWMKKAFPIKSLVQGASDMLSDSDNSKQRKDANKALDALLRGGVMERDNLRQGAEKKFSLARQVLSHNSKAFAGNENMRRQAIGNAERGELMSRFIAEFYDAAGVNQPTPDDMRAAKDAAWSAASASLDYDMKRDQKIITPSKGSAVIKNIAQKYKTRRQGEDGVPAPELGPVPPAPAPAPAVPGPKGAFMLPQQTFKHVIDLRTGAGENVHTSVATAKNGGGRGDSSGRMS